MKKLLLCNVRMGTDAKRCVYVSDDKHLPASDTPVRYPVMAFLEKTLKEGEELKTIMLVKMDPTDQYRNNILTCQEEFDQVAAKTGAKITTEVIYTPFQEDAKTHGELLMNMVEKIDEGSEIIMDMTFGPKDLTIVEFSALNFAHQYLKCEIGEIMYGQAVFVDDKPTNTKICEMGSLFYLNNLISDIKGNDPAKAMKMLKMLLEMGGLL